MAIGFNAASGGTLVVGASLGGYDVQVSDPISGTFGGSLTELRFRAYADESGSNPTGEVVEFAWLGGQIAPGVLLTATDMPTAFNDLSFLNGP